MPVLTRRSLNLDRPASISYPHFPPSAPSTLLQAPGLGSRAGLLATCSNPGCGSGWLHLLRSRSAPIFEGGWTCSPACTTERLTAALVREMDGRGTSAGKHRHRIPLGLLMMEQGWITAMQLRSALQGQRDNQAGRLGHWLMAREGISEQLVTRALGLQWSCPVLPLESHDPEGLAALLPRFFVDAFGALPLRIAAGRLIYLGFEDRLDPILALALERISGIRVESGIVQGSLFQAAHARMLEAAYPRVELLEAVSEQALARALARRIEQVRPVESRMVRVHDCFWLRMWRKTSSHSASSSVQNVIQDAIQDVICTIAVR